MRGHSDLAGVLRAAYACAYQGDYAAAQGVLTGALDFVRGDNDNLPSLDEDILLTCLEWLQDTAAVFNGANQPLVTRAEA
jgi:hypothetical protein